MCMVGSFFIAQNEQTRFVSKTPISDKKLLFALARWYDFQVKGSIRDMDILEVTDRLFDNEELQDIPMEYIFRVAYEVFVIMAEGDCFYKVDFD